MTNSVKHTRRPSFTPDVPPKEQKKSEGKISTQNKVDEPSGKSPSLYTRAEDESVKAEKNANESEVAGKPEAKSLGKTKSLRSLILPLTTINNEGKIIISPRNSGGSTSRSTTRNGNENNATPSVSEPTSVTSSVTTNAPSSGSLISPRVATQTGMIIPPISPRPTQTVSQAGALLFDDLPELYQDIIRKNNGVITNPKDLANLFFLVETECGKLEPSKSKIDILFRGGLKIINVPTEISSESINLLEIYWSSLAKEAFDNDELKVIQRKIFKNYKENYEVYNLVSKNKTQPELMGNEISFTVMKVIINPLIQYFMGGNIAFNKQENENILREQTKISRLLCEFLFTLDEKIIDWFEKHGITNKTELNNARKNCFTSFVAFRGLIKIWTDKNTQSPEKNTQDINSGQHPVLKILNNFFNASADMFFEKIICCSDAEKKEILEQANKEMEIIIAKEKFESRKKEMLHSGTTTNLPTDKFLSKTSSRNMTNLYNFAKESYASGNKAYSVAAREQVGRLERSQFIDKFMNELGIPIKFPEFAIEFKNSLIDLTGREFKTFEKRPYMACRDQFMTYLADKNIAMNVDIRHFIDELNKEIAREVDEIEQGQKMRTSRRGSEVSSPPVSQDATSEKEKD